MDLRDAAALGVVQATGGDPLKPTVLFGISDPTAIRYCLELDLVEQVDQVAEPDQRMSADP